MFGHLVIKTFCCFLCFFQEIQDFMLDSLRIGRYTTDSGAEFICSICSMGRGDSGRPKTIDSESCRADYGLSEWQRGRIRLIALCKSVYLWLLAGNERKPRPASLNT